MMLSHVQKENWEKLEKKKKKKGSQACSGNFSTGETKIRQAKSTQ